MSMNSPTMMLAVLVVTVVLCSSPSSSRAESSNSDELLVVQELEASGFRQLLGAKAGKPISPNQDCSSKYSKLNFKPVTTVCKPKMPATKACCAAFKKFACQYRSQVNNFNSICPILFMAYLNYAGGYQDGYFIGKCIDGKKGLCA